ncbi:glutamine--scyllo-inositol aminotransferase [Paenibacillus baekrokdamisoli]|uniref:Glutamine--scyllo-inositol aminotransferase n=1 Tax=Paenibacillus baekrokdamisoli TaxID=1712516 RepID=A0A3G9JPM3_9BACL|nr:DegT/DnrJ/EryC1/StrS family aminotransferase [Paenibacillus baekrokdamisoli]MBB3069417.1 dTDP-4-amino-4,6-dideoxygalactose transaminase [Paenibacillus baekrokdamisoli]BBH25009.1 glutamine--scyllo-inositol aminotransferase [Paenibacillus baekrokdamisoli]
MILLSDLARQFQSIKQEIFQQFELFIDSGKYIIGDYVSLLEKKIADKVGTSYAISVANGTDALILTLEAYGIGEGDEVITTPYTFFATAEAISRRGAKPVFVDVDPVTYNMDPFQVEALITPRTKAILPVHLFGQPADMDHINLLAQKYGLVVIEDACQAFGAKYKGRPVGSLGDAACFSFFPTKNLGTMGDGGIVVTSNPEIAEKIRKLRHHGSKVKYYHDDLGYNSRLDELHAMILLIALDRIDIWNDRRRILAERYRKELFHLPYLDLPEDSKDSFSVYHLFCIGSDQRDFITTMLQESGVQTGVYYPCPLHLQKAYDHLHYQKGDFPAAEKLSNRLFAIPMNPFLTESEQDEIISLLKNFRSIS